MFDHQLSTKSGVIGDLRRGAACHPLSRTFVQAAGLAFTLHVPDRLSVFNPAEHWEAEIESMASEVPA